MTRNKLPDGFADEVLDLELKLEKECTQKDVDKLIYLYSQAMEFYEPVSKDKYLSFKNRIQKLLVNPSVFSRMKSDQPTRERCLTDISGQRPPQLMKVKKESEGCPQGPSKPQTSVAPKKPSQNKNLHLSVKMSESVKNMIQDDFSSQKAALNKRLVQRKFKGINSKMNPDMSQTANQTMMFGNGSFNETSKFGDLSSIIGPEMDSNVTCSTSSLANNKSSNSAKIAEKGQDHFQCEEQSDKSFEDDQNLCKDLADLDFENVKLTS